jgi:hypothetical protein
MDFAVLRILKREGPVLFKDAGATCVRGYCHEPNGPECPRYITVIKAQMNNAKAAADWLAQRAKNGKQKPE